MEMFVRHNARIIVHDYPYADSVKKEGLYKLDYSTPISKDDTNVKAFHTDWNWQPQSIILRNLKAYIREELERSYKPGKIVTGTRDYLLLKNFWANVYRKGEYAKSHCHKPSAYSFAYFVKCKWYDSPLVFSDHGKKVRPKEGRFVAFPAFLNHHVTKHRYNDTRITLSGNFDVDQEASYIPL